MEPEITPQPSSEEREAILGALAEIARTEGQQPVSEWWRQGVSDAVLGDEEAGWRMP